MMLRMTLAGAALMAVASAYANGTVTTAPGLKFIHVRIITDRSAMPNPPADETASAGAATSSWSLPRVTYLHQPDQALDPVKLLPGVKPLLDGLKAFAH